MKSFLFPLQILYPLTLVPSLIFDTVIGLCGTELTEVFMHRLDLHRFDLFVFLVLLSDTTPHDMSKGWCILYSTVSEGGSFDISNSVSYFNSHSGIWSLNYFFLAFYTVLVFSFVLYLVSNVKDFMQYNAFSNSTTFTLVSGIDLLPLIASPLLLIYLLNLSWSGCDLSGWFGHLLFTSFQLKMGYYVLVVFYFIWVSYLGSFYYTSQEVYDYTIVSYSFFIWMLFLFYANNLLTVIFFIEILSTLIMLVIVTSTFSSTYFYNNLNLDKHNYFSQTSPTSFLQTIMFFFWISLVSSLNLFLFLTLFYLKLFTFDWYSVEFIFFYLISVSDVKVVFSLSLVWLIFLFCIFLKCGLVPFYFWKPLFFKGIPLHALFFYIAFFYFFIFYFFTYFFVVYMNELFYFNLFLNVIMLVVGLLTLVFIICESFYIKAFLAMSSILNTLLVFLALSSYVDTDYVFLI